MEVVNQHQQPFNGLSVSEFDLPGSQDENDICTTTATISNQHENEFQTSINSFNNNVEGKMQPLIKKSKKAIPSEGVKVPVVKTINNNNLKGSKGSNSTSSNNSSSGSACGRGDFKSVESTNVVPKQNSVLIKETKEVNAASSEQSQKFVSANTSTSNSHQSSIESRSVKVEVIQRVDDNPSIINSSDNLVTKSDAVPSTWAGLFAVFKNSISRKPVAKVSPFETSLSNPPQSNVIPERQLSYSAACSVAPSKASTTHGDESSLKMGEFFQKYKIDNSSVSLRPRGMINRSNNCYINASLQALIACPPFYNLMRSIPRQPVAKISTPTVDAMVELIKEFGLVSDQPYEPTGIYELWRSFRPENIGGQGDAEEFTGFLLNKLNDEMLELKKLEEKTATTESSENVANGDSNAETADDGDEWRLIENKTRPTPMNEIFSGEIKSRLQREGEYSTEVVEPFLTLQLNIKTASSINEALQNFVRKERVWQTVWQQRTLEKLPVVLVLHLQFFDYLDGCKKIVKAVKFPIELKIDSKTISSNKYGQKQKIYKLSAVVYHDGKGVSHGHYITDAFHCGSMCWLRYNDSLVKVINENSVLHPRMPLVPYLLYYRRSDTIGQ